ncbi:MAG: hypothetical protein ABSG41_00430 [Bryobacteraceae bacterium]|jgi:hypothetical protein
MARKIAGLVLLMMGASLHCVAGALAVPEIDPAAGGAALALLAGGLLIIRGRRRK